MWARLQIGICNQNETLNGKVDCEPHPFCPPHPFGDPASHPPMTRRQARLGLEREGEMSCSHMTARGTLNFIQGDRNQALRHLNPKP